MARNSVCNGVTRARVTIAQPDPAQPARPAQPSPPVVSRGCLLIIRHLGDARAAERMMTLRGDVRC